MAKPINIFYHKEAVKSRSMLTFERFYLCHCTGAPRPLSHEYSKEGPTGSVISKILARAAVPL